MIPKRLITTWICDPAHDRYTDAHRTLFAQCLASWLRLMPDYALTVITLGNLFDQGRDPWAEARVAEGNFIGASQWARVHWLTRLGGIYVDMDVEAVERFDVLRAEACVLGHIGAGKPHANNAVLAAVPQHPFLRDQLVALKQCDPTRPSFGNDSGPFLVTKLLKRRGWDGVDREARVDGIRVAASGVFHPYPWFERFTPACIGPDTLAVHHWGQSWQAAPPVVTPDPPPPAVTARRPRRRPSGQIRLLRGHTIGAKGGHRTGWPYAVAALAPLVAAQGLLVDDCVERTYFWPNGPEQKAPKRAPWIGTFHHPPLIPRYFRAKWTLEDLWASPRFQADRPAMVGAIALCHPLGDWLRAQLGPSVPVSVLTYPTDLTVPPFDLSAYEADPTLIQVGWHLRNQEAIRQAAVPAAVRKVWVRRGLPWELEHAERMRTIGPFRDRPIRGEPEIVGQLAPAAYDALLARSVILAEMVGAAASTTVVEAIARGTPLIITPLPAIVEYLGPTYPGYFSRIEEVADLLAPARVRAMATYLATMDRSRFDGAVFRAGVATAVSAVRVA